jgi:hypothetical protein
VVTNFENNFSTQLPQLTVDSVVSSFFSLSEMSLCSPDLRFAVLYYRQKLVKCRYNPCLEGNDICARTL